MLNGQNLKAFPLNIMNKTRLPTFTIPIQLSTWSVSQHKQARKRNKRHSNHKGKNKTSSVCRWYGVHILRDKFVCIHMSSYIFIWVQIYSYT